MADHYDLDVQSQKMSHAITRRGCYLPQDNAHFYSIFSVIIHFNNKQR